MQIGLGHLRLSPRDFWAMSLPEWQAAHDGLAESRGASPRDATSNAVNGGLSGARLAELMAQFPDQQEQRQQEG